MDTKSNMYVISLDAMDLNLLPTSFTPSNGKIMPLWSKSNIERRNEDYYEFQIKSTDADISVNDEPNEEMGNTICHICDIDVPTTFLNEHYASFKHKTNVKIVNTALDRIKKSIEINNSEVNKSSKLYFCPVCVTVVDKEEKQSHDQSTLHKNSIIIEKFLYDFYLLYANKNDGTESSDVEIVEDAKIGTNFVGKTIVEVENKVTDVVENNKIMTNQDDNLKNSIKINSNSILNEIQEEPQTSAEFKTIKNKKSKNIKEKESDVINDAQEEVQSYSKIIELVTQNESQTKAEPTASNNEISTKKGEKNKKSKIEMEKKNDVITDAREEVQSESKILKMIKQNEILTKAEPATSNNEMNTKKGKKNIKNKSEKEEESNVINEVQEEVFGRRGIHFGESKILEMLKANEFQIKSEPTTSNNEINTKKAKKKKKKAETNDEKNSDNVADESSNNDDLISSLEREIDLNLVSDLLKHISVVNKTHHHFEETLFFVYCKVCKVNVDTKDVDHPTSVTHFQNYLKFLEENGLFQTFDGKIECIVCKALFNCEDEMDHCSDIRHITNYEIFKKKH